MRTVTWLTSVNRRFRKEPSSGWFRRLAVRLAEVFVPAFGSSPAGATRQSFAIRLGRIGIIQLEDHCGARCLRVRRGTVWLTGTPAENAVLLQAGHRFDLTRQWPFVLQAIGDADIELLS